MVRDELFLKQYDQVWQQRRQHVGHIWTIPVVFTGSLGIFTTLLVNNKINFASDIFFKTVSFSVIIIGFSGLFCRHNFFVWVLGLLLKDLQKDPSAQEDLPQFGNDFKRRFKNDLKNFLHIFGSWFTGTAWWSVVVFGIALFTIAFGPWFTGTVWCSVFGFGIVFFIIAYYINRTGEGDMRKCSKCGKEIGDDKKCQSKVTQSEEVDDVRLLSSKDTIRTIFTCNECFQKESKE